MESGNDSAIEKVNKIEEFDCWGVPDIAEFAKDLTSTEIRVIEELVIHNPKEKWYVTAKRIGISERRLRQLRRKEIIQDIVFRIKLAEVKSDLADVYSVLTKKALTGDTSALKLYLEHIADIDAYFKLIRRQNEDLYNCLITELQQQLPPEPRLIILRKLKELAHTYNK